MHALSPHVNDLLSVHVSFKAGLEPPFKYRKGTGRWASIPWTVLKMTGVSTTDLCDAHMDRIEEGKVSILAPIFQSYGRRRQFHGPATTMKVFEDNTKIREALEKPGAGNVLVIDGGGSMRCALLGGNLAEIAKENLWAGIIVNGCVRDVDEINAIDIGVRALALHPKKSFKRGQGERDVRVHIGGCQILPGDWVYVDNDGIVVSSGGEKIHVLNPSASHS